MKNIDLATKAAWETTAVEVVVTGLPTKQTLKKKREARNTRISEEVEQYYKKLLEEHTRFVHRTSGITYRLL